MPEPSLLVAPVRELLASQKQSWPLLRGNLAKLKDNLARDVPFDRFSVTVQFNPGRLASSMAKVDAQSIVARQCFLCDPHRPVEQANVDAGAGYKILCNPFPILEEHFTIVRTAHGPQRIGPHFAKMVDLACELGPVYTVFYNGPQCGASAPDHMHFQAGTTGVIPVERDYQNVKRFVGQRGALRVFVSENYLRYFIGLESDNRQDLLDGFACLHDRFAQLAPDDDEPKMNVLTHWQGGSWRTILFPRSRHRPDCYYATDLSRILLSPGTVDISGLVITVLKEDFERTTREDLIEMYRQVTVTPECVSELLKAACDADFTSES